MLAVVKQSKLPFLLLAIIGNWFDGFLFCLLIGLYVTGVLKVRTYHIANNFIQKFESKIFVKL